MPQATDARLSTGVSGLDEILHGGLQPGRTYLVSGGPGCGKSILGLHFLIIGAAADEKTLYISLEESKEHIRQNTESLGFDLENVVFLDLSPTSEFFTEMQSYDLFSPAEVEREPISQQIMEQVKTLRPQRIFLDGMTQFRYLTNDPFQFRKQVLSFLRFLSEQGSTVLFSSEASPDTPDADLRFMSDGIIELRSGQDGRTVSITKFRGSGFRKGRHSMRLDSTGMQVFPRLVPASYRREFPADVVNSGVPELDELLHGGLERGTVTIISGPSGVGKTTLGLQFMKEAAERGKRSVVYTFEEGVGSILKRCEGISLPIGHMMEKGSLSIIPVEPLLYSPDEFAALARQEIESHDTGIAMIDSTAGYALSFQDQDIGSHLHALCKFMTNMGTTVILINEVEMVTGDFRATEIGISYLADNIIFLRYVEVEGQMRKTIGVLKKRLSDFEKSLHEFEITRSGLKVKKPLTGLQGILSGAPEATESDQNES